MDIIERESPSYYEEYFLLLLLSLITFRKVKWVEKRQKALKKKIQYYRNYKKRL